MKSERVAREVVAVAAWFFLALIAFAVVQAFVPSIQQGLSTAMPGTLIYLLIKVLTLVTVVVLLGGWGATIWHAAVNPSLKSGQRAAVIILTVFATPAATPLYYFGYLVWTRPAHAPAAV